MKPRSHIERQFVEYAQQLPPIWNEIEEYAYSNHFNPQAIFWQHRGNNQEIWCQCCGHREPCDSWLVMSVTEYVCPKCGKVCRVINIKDKPRIYQTYYLSVFDIFNGIQVVRTFEVSRYNCNDKGPTSYGIRELYQNWILEKGREIITSRPYSRSYNFLHWDTSAGYSIQRHNERCGGYYCYDDLFEVSENYIFPKIKLAKYLRTGGVNTRFLRMLIKKCRCLTESLSRWLKYPYLETLWKIGQRDLFWYFMQENRGKHLERYRDSIKIALRHGYEFKDVALWCDYIDDLRELDLDTHSPYYVCPQDLIAAHARMTARVRRLRDRKAYDKQIKEIAAYEPKYQERVKPYVGLRFQISDIEITCLPTVQSVYAEGAAMNHCIFQREYYKNIHSLLMSARRISTGERLETLEISLLNFTVLQCRGRHNTATPQHETIMRLAKANMKRIRSISKSIAI